MVGGEQFLNLTAELHSGRAEHNQVVTDPLEVGDEVRGENDARSLLDDDFHQSLQERTPGKGVQARRRFVEEEQIGSLGDRKRQGELSPLAT